MKIQNLVQKFSKGILFFIVVLLALSLVVWSNPVNSDQDEAGDAGLLFGEVTVSRAAYNVQFARAYCSYAWDNGWRLYFEHPLGRMILARTGVRLPPRPEEAQVAQIAWRNIALLEDARRKGILVGEQEVLARLTKVHEFLLPNEPYKDERMAQVAGDYFYGSRLTTFLGWLEDQVVIEKLLAVIADSEFEDYAKIYGEVLSRRKLVRVWAAPFDPHESMREVKAPAPDRIASYYEENKERFRVPEKVQVSYLLSRFDDWEGRVPDPGDGDARKYYDDNLAEFEEHGYAPGEEHREDEAVRHRPFDAVRGEIVRKLRDKAAREKARAFMKRVNTAIGAGFKDGKYPDDAFESAATQARNEGPELVHDVSSPIGRSAIEEVEKIVGGGSPLQSWAFEPGRAEGDISDPAQTDKGVVLFRLLKKKDGYVAGLTEPVRERIVRALNADEITRKTEKRASDAAEEARKRGVAVAREGSWVPSRYFEVPGGDPGFEDATLADAVRQAVSGNVVPGHAASFSGSALRSRDREDWAYAVYVEDVLPQAPGDLAAEFEEARESRDRQARQRARDAYITQIVALADVQDFAKKVKDPASGKVDGVP